MFWGIFFFRLTFEGVFFGVLLSPANPSFIGDFGEDVMGTGFVIAAVLSTQDLSVGGDSTGDNLMVVFPVCEEVILSLWNVCCPSGVVVKLKDKRRGVRWTEADESDEFDGWC